LFKNAIQGASTSSTYIKNLKIDKNYIINC
jgi:hypothetical protein